MTRQQRRELTWPLVAIVAIGAAFVIAVLLVIPKDAPEIRTALLGALVTGVVSVLAAVQRSVQRSIDDRPAARAARGEDDEP